MDQFREDLVNIECRMMNVECRSKVFFHLNKKRLSGTPRKRLRCASESDLRHSIFCVRYSIFICRFLGCNLREVIKLIQPQFILSYSSSTNFLPFTLNKYSRFCASPFSSKLVSPVTPGKPTRFSNSSLISLRYRICSRLATLNRIMAVS